ncbi:E3 ubiquitin-protein ligase listerin isoform X2 [Scleropages formosus]|uniref:E3 ubiquitin-protein ligase listerin isoform X2 n=1 Tax=Scleropages formosus TaxID=113540 RepID=UPI0008787E52|nr:E3 ubiquitin-protein ligase listerin isoform X2 [Scleropages formosus]
MGGKNKQRTKGNVRPSSSGRAAELLARDSGLLPCFVGFGSSTSHDLGYVPALHGSEDIDSLVDADFRLVLRKLSKRDTVTKLKAVQEFGIMCQEREAEVVKGVLPYWPRIYCKISVDHDRRVREATQQAFEQLILKVKRSLAPYLKSIMGHWLIAQCDTYPPAASAATVAFQAAFPLNKQAEALGFCKEEVLNILQDNLLKETPETLSDSQCVPEEERLAKYTRLVTSSFLALKKLLATLSQQDLDALAERLPHLAAQSKFWKYSRHKTPQIRGAFFEAVSALCDRTPKLVQAQASCVCPAVLLSIDDTDPVVLPPLWEAVLHVLSNIPDCWTHVNARKGVLPKLWLLLREGGKGLATILHPNLLPFISKLPKDITVPQLDFYCIFFTSIIQGLSSERAASSPSESAAIVCATMECLRFRVLQNASEDEDSRSVQRMLLVDQLLPLVDRAVGSVLLQHGPLFAQVTDMLVSWEKRAGLGSGPTDEDSAVSRDPIFRELVADFWEGLGRMCVYRVDQEEEREEALVGLATLLRVMQNPARPNWRKKTAKICFSDPGDSEGGPEGEEEGKGSIPADGHEGPSLLRSGHLEQLVCQLAELAMVHVTERDSERHLRFLSVLLASFPSHQLFRVLLEPGTEDFPEDGEQEAMMGLEGQGEHRAALARNPAVIFLFQKVVVWLKQDWREDTELLVNMIFSVLHCCGSREEKTIILNHITEMELRWGILLQIIQKACDDPVALEASVGWLKGPVLGEKLVGLARELCAVGLRGPRGSVPTHIHTHSWALISLVLSQQLNSEAVIGDVYVQKIIDQLHATLSDAKDLSDAGNMRPLVSFICDVASNFFSSMKGCLLLASAEELLLTLFQLCAQDQDVTRLSDSLLQKLRHACFTGVCSLVTHAEPKLKDGTFLHSVATWVRNQLLTPALTVKSLQVLVAAVQSLAESLVGAGQRGSHLLSQFMSHLTPSEEEWRRIREALPPQWVKSSLLSGRLRVTCSYPCMDVWKFRASTKLPAHLSTSALLGRILLTIMDSDGQQGADMKYTVSEVLFALQWCVETENSPAVMSDYCALLRDLNVTWEAFCKKGTTNCDVLETLLERSLKEGALWALTLANYIQSAEVSSANVQRLCGNVESFFPLTEASLSTVLVLCPSLPAKEKESLIALCVAALLNWQNGDQDLVQIYAFGLAGGTANLAVLQHCLRTGATADAEVLLAVTATLMEWRNGKEDLFLFNSDLKKVSAGLLSLNVEMMRFLSWVTTHSPAVLRDTQWDMLLCSMLAWLETATENTAAFWNPWVQLFVCENCHLIVTLSKFFSSPPTGVADQLPSNLTTEWEEFFMEGIHTRLLPMLVKITEEFTDPDDPLFPFPVLRSAGEALCYMPVSLLTENKLPARFMADQRTNLPEQLQTLLNTLAPLLLFKARPVQLTVFQILNKVMPQLPEFDNDSDNAKCDEDDEEEPCLSPPAALMSILFDMEELLEGILGGVQVGEFAVVQPLSDEYCCILGYLLAWKLILTFFKASPSQLRVQYSLYLRKSRSLNKLLQHLFRLMPENPTLPGQVAEPGSKDTRTFFTESLDLSLHRSDWLEREVPHLACSVYYSALKDLPAMIRLWWNGQEKRVSSTVEKFTSKYVSGMLSSQEIASVQASTQSFESMTVKARSTTREVIATYSVDDIFIELVIQLPQNYPLGSISVESGRRVGVAVQQWRNWMLQLSTYLTHQNGSIMEGLALWKNNVDKRFEGVEDCMICFSVIHGSNYSLPKKACRTCKKKFHSACLYKWFTSSNKSTCPLCRDTFF